MEQTKSVSVEFICFSHALLSQTISKINIFPLNVSNIIGVYKYSLHLLFVAG